MNECLDGHSRPTKSNRRKNIENYFSNLAIAFSWESQNTHSQDDMKIAIALKNVMRFLPENTHRMEDVDTYA